MNNGFEFFLKFVNIFIELTNDYAFDSKDFWVI